MSKIGKTLEQMMKISHMHSSSKSRRAGTTRGRDHHRTTTIISRIRPYPDTISCSLSESVPGHTWHNQHNQFVTKEKQYSLHAIGLPCLSDENLVVPNLNGFYYWCQSKNCEYLHLFKKERTRLQLTTEISHLMKLFHSYILVHTTFARSWHSFW